MQHVFAAREALEGSNLLTLRSRPALTLLDGPFIRPYAGFGASVRDRLRIKEIVCDKRRFTQIIPPLRNRGGGPDLA